MIGSCWPFIGTTFVTVASAAGARAPASPCGSSGLTDRLDHQHDLLVLPYPLYLRAAEVVDHHVGGPQAGLTGHRFKALVCIQEQPRQLQRPALVGVAPCACHLGYVLRRPRKHGLAALVGTRERTGAVVAPEIWRANFALGEPHQKTLRVERVHARSMSGRCKRLNARA